MCTPSISSLRHRQRGGGLIVLSIQADGACQSTLTAHSASGFELVVIACAPSITGDCDLPFVPLRRSTHRRPKSRRIRRFSRRGDHAFPGADLFVRAANDIHSKKDKFLLETLMDSYELWNKARHDTLRLGLGRLIELVGTPKFEDEVLHVAHEATRCEHLTAFAVRSSAGPRVVYAANIGPARAAKTVAREYLRKYWELDPARLVDQTSPTGQRNIAIRIVSHDIADCAYRDECYTSFKFIERFTYMQRRSHETVCLNFYRGARVGPFGASDIERICNTADLLISLMMKQETNRPDREAENDTTSTFIERFCLLDPSLPPREAEICGAIAAGLTSEAIALTLGISINTVLTYRKRAYQRLGVSSQNELMRLVLT
jgi:DNA-binding CsgD family transcriptional regulator